MPVLSIILPFYKKVQAFVKAVQRNNQYFNPNYEIVLLLDNPGESDEVVKIAKDNKGIQWSIFENKKTHEWRNPAKPINVGIKQARSDVVLILSPETLWLTDVPGQLLDKVNSAPSKYHFGAITLSQNISDITVESFETEKKWSCGSLCCKTDHLKAVRGYDESLDGWGADDDNIRRRLILNGVFAEHHPEIKLAHPKDSSALRKYSASTSSRLGALVNPTDPYANTESWGTDFDTLIYRT